MTSLLLASLTFFFLHRVISGSRLRDVIVARIEESVYRNLFALASLACLTWLWAGYTIARGAPSNFELFSPSAIAHYLQPLVQFVAITLVVLGLSTRNPTIAGMGDAVRQPGIVSGALRITRHPFLWGVSIFAAGHLLVEADLASWIFFGSLVVLALTGTLSIDAKRRRALGSEWDGFARLTSNVPFAAILAGRQRLDLKQIGWPRFGAAVATYVVLIVAHPILFGGTALP
jgi:uncharacterized membrane protein